jgi:hypothetical protein
MLTQKIILRAFNLTHLPLLALSGLLDCSKEHFNQELGVLVGGQF